jgi:hypothetical protein
MTVPFRVTNPQHELRNLALQICGRFSSTPIYSDTWDRNSRPFHSYGNVRRVASCMGTHEPPCASSLNCKSLLPGSNCYRALFRMGSRPTLAASSNGVGLGSSVDGLMLCVLHRDRAHSAVVRTSAFCWDSVQTLILLWLGMPTVRTLFGPVANHYALLRFGCLLPGISVGRKDGKVLTNAASSELGLPC